MNKIKHNEELALKEEEIRVAGGKRDADKRQFEDQIAHLEKDRKLISDRSQSNIEEHRQQLMKYDKD